MTDITFNWTVTGLSVSDGQDGLVGIVRTISWKLEAAHPDGTAEAVGTERLPSPDPEEFVAA